MGKGAENSGIWNAISRVRDVAFIAAVYLFFAGFIYRYYYLTSFGIDPKFEDSGLYSVLVYAYSVFDDVFQRNPFTHRWLWVIAAALLIVAVGTNAYLRETRRLYRWKAARVAVELRRVALPAAVIVALILIPWVFNAAERAGLSDAAKVRAAHNGIDYAVSVTLTDDAAKHYDNDIQSALASYSLRLISESDSVYYFLNQPPNPAQTGVMRGAVFAVRKNDVQSIKLALPGRD
jgi:hypothetical protein